MSFIQWCSERGPKSHVAKKISGRRRRRSRERWDNQRVGDFCFINIFHIFLLIFFFNYFTSSFFCILFLPTTFTHTHDPRHLATLAVSSSCGNNTTGVSQIICVKCQREVLKFSKWKNSGKKCNGGLRNQFREYHLTRQKRCAKDSQAESGLTDRLEKKPLCLSSFSLKKNAEVTFALKRLINRHSKDTAS